MIKKVVMSLVLFILIIIPINAFALGHLDTIINSNGVEMTLEEYTNLRKVYSELHIDTMTQDDFDEAMAMNFDFDSAQSVLKYYRTEYNHLTGQTTSTEITEAEYISGGMNNNNNQPQATYVETNYKWILLNVLHANDDVFFSLTAHWKIMPSTRSFDVIAARFVNLGVINGTQGGKQMYTISGSNGYINYSFNGTNIHSLSNGYGISMNLVNDSGLTALELELDGCLEVTSYPAVIYASYQHATSSTTLSESQEYTLSSVGLGNVINFTYSSTSNKYDGMPGTYQYLYAN